MLNASVLILVTQLHLLQWLVVFSQPHSISTCVPEVVDKYHIQQIYGSSVLLLRFVVVFEVSSTSSVHSSGNCRISSLQYLPPLSEYKNFILFAVCFSTSFRYILKASNTAHINEHSKIFCSTCRLHPRCDLTLKWNLEITEFMKVRVSIIIYGWSVTVWIRG